jgi:ABC-type multidrug transport system permease subunit
MFTAIMGGMLIAINIIEEKSDRTIRSIHLTPVSRNGYLIGKSLIGAILPLYGAVLIIWITGFKDINWLHLMLLVIASSIITVLVGFIEGINNETVMDAAGSVKMLFLPLAGAIAIAELLGDKWQWVAYWVPFYWTYKGIDDVLTYNSELGTTLLYTLFVIIISVIVYLLLMPKIKKGLE